MGGQVFSFSRASSVGQPGRGRSGYSFSTDKHDQADTGGDKQKDAEAMQRKKNERSCGD